MISVITPRCVERRAECLISLFSPLFKEQNLPVNLLKRNVKDGSVDVIFSNQECDLFLMLNATYAQSLKYYFRVQNSILFETPNSQQNDREVYADLHSFFKKIVPKLKK